MNDKNLPKQVIPNPTRLHKALGVLSAAVFLVSYLIDMLPGYTVRPTLATILAVSFLTLLGFGHIVGIALDLYGAGRVRGRGRDQHRDQHRDRGGDN